MPSFTCPTCVSLSILTTLIGVGTHTLAATNATDYAWFQTQYFVTAEQTNPTLSSETADPDHDGLNNLLEYALRLDPKVANASSWGTLAQDSNHLTLTFLRRKDAIDIGYTVEVSSDLETWNSGSDFTAEIAVTPIDSQADRVTVRDLTPLSPTVKRFVRLKVDQLTRLTTKSDLNATPLTRIFYDNLKALTGLNQVAFGQQFATWKGVNANGTPWQGDLDRSDIKTITDSHPAVSGWNFEIYLSSSSTDKTKMRQRIISDFARGMIITLHWEMRNPNSGLDSKDRTDVDANPTVVAQTVTAGTLANTQLKADLDQLATLLSQLSYNGSLIPVIFRPYHEMDGGWFWWGQADVNEFTALWNYTLTYLRDSKAKHQLLYCFSPSGNQFDSTTEYLTYWPGDGSVDICGVDQYLQDTDPISKWNDAMLLTHAVAAERDLPAAFAEIGRRAGLTGTTNTAWWTSRVLAAFDDPTRPLWNKCAYILTWTNQSTSSYWVPYHNEHPQADDFKTFVADPHLRLQSKLPSMYSVRSW